MRILAPLGLLLLAGCSSVPVQPMQQTADTCDYAQMSRIEHARQPILLERYWVHCPQLKETTKTS